MKEEPSNQNIVDTYRVLTVTDKVRKVGTDNPECSSQRKLVQNGSAERISYSANNWSSTSLHLVLFLPL